MTLSEWADILHDENTGVVWYSAKNSGNFTIQIFHQSDENRLFFKFWQKCAFHDFNLKMIKINT